MNIEHEDNGTEGRFFMQKSGTDVAVMEYIWRGSGQIVITHTEVDPSLEGQGIGKQLLAATVAFAREQHLSIFPVCPYAKAVMHRSDEYKDVLAAGS